jgi:hypothetical protein
MRRANQSPQARSGRSTVRGQKRHALENGDPTPSDSEESEGSWDQEKI